MSGLRDLHLIDVPLVLGGLVLALLAEPVCIVLVWKGRKHA